MRAVLVLQVTFLNAASTPREIKLLHAPTLTSAFRLLPAQLTISAQDANRRLQHSLSVSPNIPVMRFLKVEMAGLALDNAAGAPDILACALSMGSFIGHVLQQQSVTVQSFS